MSLIAIWAQGHNRVIGKDATMAWHVPEDLAMFKRVTTGHPVIMGRTTWESLEERFRPLPGRTNIVVTRNRDYVAPGATVVHSLEEARQACEGTGFVMGGAQIYAACLDVIDGIILTDIDIEVADPDAYAPPLPDWEIVAADPDRGWHTSTTGLAYRFTALRRPRTDPFGPDPLKLDSDLTQSETL